MLKRFAINLGFLLAIAACSKGGHGLRLSSEATVVDEPASQFYARFQYKNSDNGICKFAQPLPAFLGTPLPPPPSLEKVPSEALVQLFIQPDGTFRADYIVRNSEHVVLNKKSHTDKWRIDGQDLVLQGVGRGRGDLLGGEKIIRLKVDAGAGFTGYETGDVEVSEVSEPCSALQ